MIDPPDYDPNGRAQAAADSRKICLVSKIEGRIVIVLPLDPTATMSQILDRVDLVNSALQGIRFRDSDKN